MKKIYLFVNVVFCLVILTSCASIFFTPWEQCDYMIKELPNVESRDELEDLFKKYPDASLGGNNYWILTDKISEHFTTLARKSVIKCKTIDELELLYSSDRFSKADYDKEVLRKTITSLLNAEIRIESQYDVDELNTKYSNLKLYKDFKSTFNSVISKKLIVAQNNNIDSIHTITELDAFLDSKKFNISIETKEVLNKFDGLCKVQIEEAKNVEDLMEIASDISRYYPTGNEELFALFTEKVFSLDNLGIPFEESAEILTKLHSINKELGKFLDESLIVFFIEECKSLEVLTESSIVPLRNSYRVFFNDDRIGKSFELALSDCLFEAMKEQLDKALSITDIQKIVKDYPNLVKSDDRVTAYIDATYFRLFSLTAEEAKSNEELDTAIEEFSQYISIDNSNVISYIDNCRSEIAKREAENNSYNEILNLIENKESLASDIVQKCEKYKENFGNINADKNKQIESILNEYIPLAKIEAWKNTAKYKKLITSVSEEYLDLPIVLGHNRKAYEETDKTLRDLLSTSGLEEFGIFLTQDDFWDTITLDLSKTIMLDVSYVFAIHEDYLLLEEVSSTSFEWLWQSDYNIIKLAYTILNEDIDLIVDIGLFAYYQGVWSLRLLGASLETLDSMF